MSLDRISKDNNGAGVNKYFKDIFPERLTTLFVYKGTNLNHRGKEIFSREDDLSMIYLEEIAKVEGIFGGSSYTIAPTTVEEEKTIKEIELKNISTKSFTGFIEELGFDYEESNLFFTLGEPFQQQDINIENEKVFIAVNSAPNIFANLISNIGSLSEEMVAASAKRTISFTLSPAIFQNNIPSSKISFIDGSQYPQLPTTEKDFEITSIDVESDHSFLPEYGNWVKGKGKLGNEESDIDFKMNKPLTPIRITPYAKQQKLEFIIRNFVKFFNMPWLYAKHFLGNDRTIEGYIKQGSTAQYAIDLAKTVVDMFKMAHAFNTNFQEYRNASGEIENATIGGVSLKGLESKSGKQVESTVAVTQVLKNWEYKYPNDKKSDEYIRTIQLLAASSEWVASEYSFGGVLSEAHKTELDFFLDLTTKIDKDTTSISMKLNSLRYEFDVSDTSNPRIKALKTLDSSSNVLIDETDRIVSIPEIDDPIKITDFSSKPSDFNIKSLDLFKYIVGVDITNPSQIEKFFIDQENSTEKIETISTTVDTNYVALATPWGIARPDKLYTKLEYNGVKIEVGLTDNELIKQSINIPPNAFDISIKSTGVEKSHQFDVSWKDIHPDNFRPWFETKNATITIKRFEGAVIEYKIKTTTHGAKNKVYSYDKPKLMSMLMAYVDNKDKWKRNLTLSKFFEDDNGNQTVKIKSINRLLFSFMLGNYLDIKINYKYKDSNDIEQVGSTNLPRITLPSVNDETRTKFGIRF